MSSSYKTLYKLKDNGNFYIWRIELKNIDEKPYSLVSHGQKNGKISELWQFPVICHRYTKYVTENSAIDNVIDDDKALSPSTSTRQPGHPWDHIH